MYADRLAKLESLRRGMAYLANREISRGFGGWLEAVAPRDDPMSKALRHLVNREMSRGWVGWSAWRRTLVRWRR